MKEMVSCGVCPFAYQECRVGPGVCKVSVELRELKDPSQYAYTASRGSASCPYKGVMLGPKLYEARVKSVVPSKPEKEEGGNYGSEIC
jgi:hypothetical protein